MALTVVQHLEPTEKMSYSRRSTSMALVHVSDR